MWISPWNSQVTSSWKKYLSDRIQRVIDKPLSEVILVYSSGLYSCGVDTDTKCRYRADYRFLPSQWETSLQSNAVAHRLGANIESTLRYMCFKPDLLLLFLFQQFDYSSLYVIDLFLFKWQYIDGLVQHYNNSSVLAMELLKSCTKPLIYCALSSLGLDKLKHYKSPLLLLFIIIIYKVHPKNNTHDLHIGVFCCD